MRALKWAGYIAAGLIALLAIALVLVVLWVDPNDYRDDIERIVERKTGRELNLSGELQLSVFPWIALASGPASLGEAPGFGDEPFVSISQARIGVRLLPLLAGKVEIGTVRLVGARIRLITDESGRRNWADLGAQEESTAAAAAADGPGEWPTIAGLQIRDAALTIENRRERTRRVVRDFNLETGRLAAGEPFALASDFVLEQERALSVNVHFTAIVTADLERDVHQLAQPEIDVTLSGQGYPAQGVPVQIRARALQADIGRELYRLDGLTLKTTWKSDGAPPQGIPVALSAGDCSANLAEQTLALTALAVQAAGAQLTGSLTGAEILDAPRLTGTLRLAPVALREWLPQLGIEAPRTSDPSALQQLSFAGNVTLTKSSAELAGVTLKLDETTMTGMLGIADFAAKALRFDLSIDRIDADRYLPAPSAAPAGAGKEAPAEIPVELLRTLNARGQLAIGEAIFAGMKFTKLRLGVNAREGKIRLHPAQAAMYGGEYRGDIGIDAAGNAARVTLDEHVSGVSFAPLFKDLFQTERVAGKGSAHIKLSGAGRTTDDIMKTLDGSVDFNVVDGALDGADLWYEIRRARALLKQQPIPERSGPPRTSFTALSGSGVMKDGVLTNDDLDVAMQYLKVTGRGTVDLPRDALDYQLTATVLKIPAQGADASQLQDLVDARIPVKVGGTLTDPKVRPDLEGYLKSQVQERVQKEREKVEEKIQDKLGDKLKDLFRR